MNVLVLVALHFIRYGAPPWTIVLLPLVFVPLAIFTLGVGWLLASLGVYFRDVSQITGVIATAMLFLSTAIVPVETVPAAYRFLFYLNPLSFIIDQARNVALWGRLPDWSGLGLYALGALAFAWLALAWFQGTRRGFADVL
jgi:lipopolysaccharide transport system permease protein